MCCGAEILYLLKTDFLSSLSSCSVNRFLDRDRDSGGLDVAVGLPRAHFTACFANCIARSAATIAIGNGGNGGRPQRDYGIYRGERTGRGGQTKTRQIWDLNQNHHFPFSPFLTQMRIGSQFPSMGIVPALLLLLLR